MGYRVSQPGDSGELPSILPLFPLPNVVALPGVALHLHVFEKRYRQLLLDLDADNPYLALALVAKGQHNADPNPPIHSIVCAGRLTHVQPLEDGRYFVIFASMGRARLLGEDLTSHTYRVGQVAWIDPGIDAEPAHLGLKLEIYNAFARYAGTVEDLPEKLEQLRGLDLPLGRLVDMLSSCMPLDLELQRRMLEELEPSKRALLLLTILSSVSGNRDRFSVH